MKEARSTPGSALADIIAQVAPVMLAAVAASPEALEALRKIKSAISAPAGESTKTAGLTKAELAKAIGVSTSTVDRLDREGAPHTFVGDHKRYDLETYQAWLSSRGKKPTGAA